MAEGRGRAEWARAAQISHLVYVTGRGPDWPRLSVEEFSPFTRGKVREPDLELDAKEGMALLKRLVSEGVWNGG